MIMILAPHMDDEVLGCASLLKGSVVVYFTQGHPSFPGWLEEQERMMEAGGFESELLDYPIHHLDTIPQARFIGNVEKFIQEWRPDTVVIPFASYNQDHRAVHEAALTAMRPNDKLHFVKRILVYEEPDVLGTFKDFRPAYFRPVDIDEKCRLVSLYKSQVRGHRSDDVLMAMATIRGMQSRLSYAEAFEVLRWVD